MSEAPVIHSVSTVTGTVVSMGQSQSAMDHPAFACMNSLYRHDLLKAGQRLLAQESLQTTDLTQLLAYILPKCNEIFPSWSEHASLIVPGQKTNDYHVQITLKATDLEAKTLDEPMTVQTRFPDALLIRHRDDMLEVVTLVEQLHAAQAPAKLELLRQLLQKQRQLIQVHGDTPEVLQTLDQIDTELAGLNQSSLPLPHDQHSDTTTADVYFLRQQFILGVGRCVRTTLEGLESIEQYEVRRKEWPTVRALMVHACAIGAARDPPIPGNILSYYCTLI